MIVIYSLRLRWNTEPGYKAIIMEMEIVAVYYGISVDRSLNILRYVWIVAARRRPAVA